MIQFRIMNVCVASNVRTFELAYLQRHVLTMSKTKIVNELSKEFVTHFVTPKEFDLDTLSPVHFELIRAMVLGIAIVSTEFFGPNNQSNSAANFIPEITATQNSEVIPSNMLEIRPERRRLFADILLQ